MPLRVVAHALGRTAVLDAKLADERAFGLGAGISLLAPLAAQTTLEQTLRSLAPAHTRLCARFFVRERKRPLGFCNGYASTDAALVDASQAGALVESFDLPTLPLARVELVLNARPGMPSDVIVAAQPPARVRAGARVRVRLQLRRRGSGATRTLTVPVRVPRALRPGPRLLVIEGSNENSLSDLGDELLQGFEILLDVGGEGPRRPRSLAALEGQLRSLHHPEGIVARFRGRGDQLVVAAEDVAYEGRVRVPVRVLKRSR